ncbi:MAG: LiaI-LiaF-like domain-containing protein, partial [Candidatus Acidiferrales bacterium]
MNFYPRQRSSIFSGLLLILLGTLFLLERFDPQLGVGHLLRAYWPVLLILWGLAKLIDHLAATRSGEVAPPILTGGEAALIILLVLVLAAMSGAEWIHSKFPNIQIQLDGANRHASQSVALPAVSVAAGEQITVQTSSGSIHVHAGSGTTLRVNADESAPGSSEEAARQRLGSVRVAIEKSGGGYVIHPVDQDGPEGAVNVNLDVEVPPQVNISAISKSGDIVISGLAG